MAEVVPLIAVVDRHRRRGHSQVLEGYTFLGTVAALGAEASACFGALASSQAVSAVQEVLPSRAGGGAPAVASMHEAVRLLPPDLLRPALAGVPTLPAHPALWGRRC